MRDPARSALFVFITGTWQAHNYPSGICEASRADELLTQTCMAIHTDTLEHLKELGFDLPLVPGQRLLPSASKGPASRRNAEGFDIVHRDQPMETAYRLVEWHWTQFAGRFGTEDMSKSVDVP